jgi:HSP20 family protein
MTLTRFVAGPEMDTLRREMDRLFENFLPARGEDDQTTQVWAPRADISENDDAFFISMDLPGIRPDDIEVTFEDGMLKVSGERHSQHEEDAGQYHRIERSYGRFFRSFRFGNNADQEQIDANFEDGVLTVRVSKREASKPRRIEVSRQHNGQRHQIEAN